MLILGALSTTRGQFRGPDGEGSFGALPTSDGKAIVNFNGLEVFTRIAPATDFHSFWQPPGGVLIKDLHISRGVTQDAFYIALNTFDVYAFTYNHTTKTFTNPVKRSPIAGPPHPFFTRVGGNGLYAMTGYSDYFTYVSRDSAKTWQVDSGGLGSGFASAVNDIALDTSRFAWAATGNGIFKQHPDSNVWHKVPIIGNPTNFSRIFLFFFL